MNKKITYKDAGVDIKKADEAIEMSKNCLLYTSPSPRDRG